MTKEEKKRAQLLYVLMLAVMRLGWNSIGFAKFSLVEEDVVWFTIVRHSQMGLQTDYCDGLLDHDSIHLTELREQLALMGFSDVDIKPAEIFGYYIKL